MKLNALPFSLPVRLRKKNVCSPLLVNISVYSGHTAEGFRERTPLASTLIERWYMAPGVQRINVREKGVQGTLFIPTGAPASPFFKSFICLLWKRLFITVCLKSVCPCLRSRALPWAVGYVGRWWRTGGVSCIFAGIPWLCFLCAEVSHPWWARFSWDRAQLFWGVCDIITSRVAAFCVKGSVLLFLYNTVCEQRFFFLLY